ncbi:MAG TPA: M23 family metallopeptidase [Mucilaginibacter sp.]|jgi:murein DD-endopeptidase MepM/ murein hydrolase activator NlpD
MKTNSSEISTVIIVNKNRQQTLQFKTKHLSHLKHYGASILVVIFLLSGAIIYLNNQNQKKEEEKKQLESQVVKLKGAIPAYQLEAKKTINAQAYVQTIEEKLQKINDYLRKRGVKGFSTKAVGGNGSAEATKLTDDETYSLYSDYLTRLLHTVAFTPMGYPRISNLTSFFGYRSDPFNSAHAEFHPGIDFRGNKGDEAKCTANGKVVFAGPYGGYGNCVRIQHINNFETLYGHLSYICVKVGQDVTLGQKIGEVGSTGRSTGAHLHYEVRKNGKPIDPIKFLTLNN